LQGRNGQIRCRPKKECPEMPTFFIDLLGEGARPAKGIVSEILEKKKKKKKKKKENKTKGTRDSRWASSNPTRAALSFPTWVINRGKPE